MKPKQLKLPYSWEERRPELLDGVLFIPDYYDKHTNFPMPSWEKIFGNSKPVIIEYCSGNGTWIAERAKDTNYNWIAVEWRFERVRQIWSKKHNYKLDNLLIVSGDAQIFIRDYLPEKSIDAVYINFPDPWPKEKHAKNRLFRPPFIAEMTRTTRPGTSLTIATDDPPYTDQIISTILSNPSWESLHPAPHYVTEWKDYGASFFDTLWRTKGREIRYLQFKKFL